MEYNMRTCSEPCQTSNGSHFVKTVSHRNVLPISIKAPSKIFDRFLNTPLYHE